MRILRFASLLALLAIVVSVAAVEPVALAQTVEDAEEDAAEAGKRVEAASGLVDEAVADRERIERELAEAIADVSETSARLSVVGADLDRIAASMGFAQGEATAIQEDLEAHAVDAYMQIVSSPATALANGHSVEDAMVIRSITAEIAEDSKAAIDSLVIRLRALGDLQQTFLTRQAEFNRLRTELNARVDSLAELYEQADAAVAEAVRSARVADEEYQAAMSAVDAARAREQELRRQQDRETTTTTSADSSSNRGSDGYLLGPWTQPPLVERWRGLVEQFFPSYRVEQALRILNCESNGDPNAYNPYSGASGLFQFIPSTWATTAHRAGYPGASPFEPEANTASAAWLANRYSELGYPYWMAWSCQRLLR